MIFSKILLPCSIFMIYCFYHMVDYSIIYEKLSIRSFIYQLNDSYTNNDTNQEIKFIEENVDKIYNDTFARCLKKSSNLNLTYQWRVKPKDCGSKVNIVLMIKSSIYKGEMRRTLRNRWAQNISISKYHVKRIFLIGSTPIGRKSSLLDQEIANYDDVLQGDFFDTYKGGTKKVLLGMRYVKQFCPFAQLIVFADDDAVLSPWTLLPYFEDILSNRSVNDNEMIFSGFEIRDSRPRRNKMDRWYVNQRDYSCEFYPTYFAGVVYAMTLPALKAVYNYSRAFDPFFCDDVLLGVLGHLAKVHFRPLPSNLYNPYCDLLYTSHTSSNSTNDILACHEAEKPIDQIFLWTKLCNQPVADYPSIIALLNAVYCRNFV